MHHKGNHYTPTARDIALRNAAKMGDHLCNQIDVWREKQGLPPHGAIRTNQQRMKRSDVQRMIDDAFAPLKASIAETVADSIFAAVADKLTNQHAPPVAASASDPAIKAMFEYSGGMLKDDPDARRRTAMAIAHNAARHGVVASADDPAVQAMSANIGAVAHLRRAK